MSQVPRPAGWELDKAARPFVADVLARQAPALFAVCAVEWDDAEESVVGARIHSWGLAFPDRAMLIGANRRSFGVYGSADQAMCTLSRVADVGLVWLDTVTPPLSGRRQPPV
jgi:hypothetical protein